LWFGLPIPLLCPPVTIQRATPTKSLLHIGRPPFPAAGAVPGIVSTFRSCATLCDYCQKTPASYLFFLLPQTLPAAISCSMSGYSAEDTQDRGCCPVYEISARTTAELVTVHPSLSDAS